MQYMIASGALLIWPVVALILYLSLPAGRATIWTILAAFMLLPVGTKFDLPGLPALDKTTIPNLAALLLAPVMARHGEFKWPKSTIVNLLMLLWILLPFATAMNNGETLVVGQSVRPGLGFKEGVSMAGGNALEIVPFILGAGLLANEKGHRDIVRAFVLAGLIYSLPILAEIRLSPFLQSSIYGVGSTEYFIQQLRSGGFRAIVFMGHGLIVSTFMAMAVIAAVGLWRMRINLFALPAGLIALYLFAVLLLNKSVGSIILIFLLVPALFLLRSRLFLTMAVAIVSIVVIYPAIRGTDLLPLHQLAASVRSFSSERAKSLEFRLTNEDALLDRAERKPFFGWGSYARNRVIVTTNWGSVQDAAVTDGSWIITIGMFGWCGYVACFGLLSYPVWHAFRLRRITLPKATMALVAMLLLNLVDLIPNSSLRPITWLIAGALASMSIASLRSGGTSRFTGRRAASPVRQAESLPEPALPVA